MIANTAAPIAIPAIAPGPRPELFSDAAVADGIEAAAVGDGVAEEVEVLVWLVEVGEADDVDESAGPPSSGKFWPGLKE